MIETLYIEDEIKNHPVTLDILNRFNNARIIPCDRYTEIFNRKAQNFRLQKKKPALILAKKHKQFVLKAPENYGIGSELNYYFSHMMNCIYDCRYCFLQGMYRSANYVLFVNFESFTRAIKGIVAKHPGKQVHFFSGYDCDSLALEPVTGFVENFLPLFKQYPDALVELRTKSTQIRCLLDRDPMDNAVVAYSLTPDKTAKALEHKAPNIEKRIDAMEALQQQGWKLGLRFDPLIYSSDFETEYAELFQQVFSRIKLESLHSVSLGSFRLPIGFHKTLSRLYPEEKLFASPLEDDDGLISYKRELRNDLMDFCSNALLEYIPESIFFPCHD